MSLSLGHTEMKGVTSKEPEKRKTHEQGIAQAPPIVKWVIWFFDPKNWQKYWKAIVVAFVVVVVALLVRFVNDKYEAPSISPSPSSRHIPLPEEEVRKAIMTMLGKGDIIEAIGYLYHVGEGAAKREECEHLFDYCIKNKELRECMLVVDQCWNGKQKEERLRQIEHERYKK